MMNLFSSLSCLFFVSFLFELVSGRSGTVFLDDNGQFEIRKGFYQDFVNGGIAGGFYKNGYYSKGWSQLTLASNENINDSNLVMKAMGYLEGAWTCNEIKPFFYNFYSTTFGNFTTKPKPKVTEFILKNDKWVLEQVAKFKDTDSYWKIVSLFLSQFDGLVEGYNNECKHLPPLSRLEFLYLNQDGDLIDIIEAFSPLGSISKYLEKLRCSAIIKLHPEFEDVFFGHATWDVYATAAPRIFKTYTLPKIETADNKFNPNRKQIMFSSSPGFLSSVDDFYTIDTDMAIMETSNSVYNKKIYDNLKPETVLSWLRVVVANYYASSGKEWSELFSNHHSGTYNNQWQVLDLKKFTPGSKPEPGFMYIFEELPGLFEAKDMTGFLIEQSYWPSYNIPYFKSISKASGTAHMASKYGHPFDYNKCPRANLFRELHTEVDSLESLQHVLGWNDWSHNPLSLNSAANAISARDDLVTKRPRSAGAIDAKASTYKQLKEKRRVTARAGMTHDELTPFCWSNNPKLTAMAHKAHPDCFNFSWMSFSLDDHQAF